MSLMRLNQADPASQRLAYGSLLPPRLWQYLAKLDASFKGGPDNPATFRVITSPDGSEAHLRVPAKRFRGDFCVSIDLEEAGAGQLRLAFIMINDLNSVRYDIDADTAGNITMLGTATRNLEAEKAALDAGLGPCQVRPGLRLYAEIHPRLEAFARLAGYVNITLEPLTYHNAVMYENYGFAYITGRKRMIAINEAFKPAGKLTRQLTEKDVFRQPSFARDSRGRSWAIHDGILEHLDGDPTFYVQMVKALGHDAGQRTFAL